VVFLLIGDVETQGPDMSRADGKRSVAVLPMKIRQLAVFGFDPLRGLPFELAQQFRNGTFPREPAENVNVVVRAAHREGRGIQVSASAAQVAMKLVAKGFILKIFFAAFGGEDDVKIDLGEGLSHCSLSMKVSFESTAGGHPRKVIVVMEVVVMQPLRGRGN
jgi:hypothetical protein